MRREEAREKAQALVSRMTVEEAAAQLRYDAPGIGRLDVPEYNWWNEGLHGVARAGTATVFPQAIGLAATFDEELLGRVADVVATEGRAKYNEFSKQGDRDIYKGLTYWSPNVNIFRDPRWGRGQETYGEDPYLTARLAVRYIRALQGEGDGVPYMKLAACAKHYAVHSGPEELRHSFDAKVGEKDLWETYLPAFEACVKEAGVEAVMGAYNRVNGEPCCAHSVLMEDILRGQWGFEGHYVSDCWAIRDFHENHLVTATAEESAALALKMGCDLNCGCIYQKLLGAYAHGLVSEEEIRASAVRLYTTRYMLGMFEKTPYDDILYEVVACEEHLALSKAAAEESIVLLKNDGILPLDRAKIKTIGVIGPNADSRKALIGNYYGTPAGAITPLMGIQDAAGEGIRVLYSEGGHLFKDKPDPLSRPYHLLSEAKTVAERSDVVVLCLGLDEYLEGEEGDEGNQYASGDKESLSLPESQLRLLETVIATGTPYVLCMMAGSAIDMRRADETASAILQAWYPGDQGGAAIASVLFGEVSPSGKLPVTIYRELDGMPDFTDYSMENRTYRHLSRAPLYPFGYGLTYGRVELVSAAEQAHTITAAVKNQSNRAVAEVLQVYIRVDSENEVRNHRLCGFARVALAPGEERTVTLDIPEEAFLTVNRAGERVADGTGAMLYVGFGQPDKRTEELTGRRGVALRV